MGYRTVTRTFHKSVATRLDFVGIVCLCLVKIPRRWLYVDVVRQRVVALVKRDGDNLCVHAGDTLWLPVRTCFAHKIICASWFYVGRHVFFSIDQKKKIIHHENIYHVVG